MNTGIHSKETEIRDSMLMDFVQPASETKSKDVALFRLRDRLVLGHRGWRGPVTPLARESALG
jgi:hypothetical protein